MSLPGSTLLSGSLRINQFDALLSVFLGDQLFERHLRKIHVGVVNCPILESQFLGFDEQMQMLGGVGLHGADVKVLQQIEDLQSGDSLAVGRDLPDVVATIARADRLDPVGGMLPKVTNRKPTAVGLGELDNLLGNLALVEGLGAVPGDGLEELRQILVSENVSKTDGLAFRHERPGQGGI